MLAHFSTYTILDVKITLLAFTQLKANLTTGDGLPSFR